VLKLLLESPSQGSPSIHTSEGKDTTLGERASPTTERQVQQEEPKSLSPRVIPNFLGWFSKRQLVVVNKSSTKAEESQESL